MSTQIIFKDEKNNTVSQEDALKWIKKAVLSVKSIALEPAECREALAKAPLPDKTFMQVQAAPVRKLRSTTKDLINYKLWAYPDAKQKKTVEIKLNDQALLYFQWLSRRLQVEASLHTLSMYMGVYKVKDGPQYEVEFAKLASDWVWLETIAKDDSWFKEVTALPSLLNDVQNGLTGAAGKERFMAASAMGGRTPIITWINHVKKRPAEFQERINMFSAIHGQVNAANYIYGLCGPSLIQLKALLEHPDHPHWVQQGLPPAIRPAVAVVLGAFMEPWNEEAFLSKKGTSVLKSFTGRDLPCVGLGWLHLASLIPSGEKDRYNRDYFDVDREKTHQWISSRLNLLKEKGWGLEVEDMRIIQRSLKALAKQSDWQVEKCFTTVKRIMDELWLEQSLNQPWEEAQDLEETSPSSAPPPKRKRL